MYMFIYIYTYIHIYIHIYIYIYVHVCVHVGFHKIVTPHHYASGGQMYDQGSQVCGRGWGNSASKQCQFVVQLPTLVLPISTTQNFNAHGVSYIILLQGYIGYYNLILEI